MRQPRHRGWAARRARGEARPTAGPLRAQGEPGDCFYIILEGEAAVFQATPSGAKKVNHLFKADFFGERALLTDEPRRAPH